MWLVSVKAGPSAYYHRTTTCCRHRDNLRHRPSLAVAVVVVVVRTVDYKLTDTLTRSLTSCEEPCSPKLSSSQFSIFTIVS